MRQSEPTKRIKIKKSPSKSYESCLKLESRRRRRTAKARPTSVTLEKKDFSKKPISIRSLKLSWLRQPPRRLSRRHLKRSFSLSSQERWSMKVSLTQSRNYLREKSPITTKYLPKCTNGPRAYRKSIEGSGIWSFPFTGKFKNWSMSFTVQCKLLVPLQVNYGSPLAISTFCWSSLMGVTLLFFKKSLKSSTRRSHRPAPTQQSNSSELTNYPSSNWFSANNMKN